MKTKKAIDEIKEKEKERWADYPSLSSSVRSSLEKQGGSMRLRITEERLEKLGSCNKSVNLLQKNKIRSIDGVDLVVKVLISKEAKNNEDDTADEYLSWANWLLCVMLTKKQRKKYKAFAEKKAEGNKISSVFSRDDTSIDGTAGFISDANFASISSLPISCAFEVGRQRMKETIWKGLQILDA